MTVSVAEMKVFRLKSSTLELSVINLAMLLFSISSLAIFSLRGVLSAGMEMFGRAG